MKKILIDTDILVAIVKEDDTNHNKALYLAEKLKGVTICISPFTIPEAATVISYKINQKQANYFLEKARQRNFLNLMLDDDTVKLADKIFFSQGKKGTSWFDCCNAAFVKINDLDGIFSFDKFYKRLGIRIIK